MFSDELLRDFPPIPLPGGAKAFSALAELGNELISIHLLESSLLDKPNTEFIGDRRCEIEKASWSHNTVWIDKDLTTGFKGVSEEVWGYHVGGYQVCEK